MEQSAKAEEVEECGICLDTLTNPVALPCSHKFCSECLSGWRSKYGAKSGEDQMDRKCPLCREKIPPSREMIAQLKFYRLRKSQLEAQGDIFSQKYMRIKSVAEKLEREVGDWTETVEYSDDTEKLCLVLPTDICKAARENNIQKVLDWLGPPPIDKQRLNARNPDLLENSLVFFAVHCKNSDLLSILLQLGADVDPVSANGRTPLIGMGYKPEYYARARLLLEWGAEISTSPAVPKNEFVECLLQKGNIELANLLKSEFGGRRCEIINLPNRPGLIGKTCVVEKYLPNKGRYKVVFETTKEVGLVGLQNLKRRDRTPDDCGYYITYKNGRTTRHEFASKEKCQAFVASLTQRDKSGDGDAEARAEQAAAESKAEESEARAEQAAQSLLAELEINS